MGDGRCDDDTDVEAILQLKQHKKNFGPAHAIKAYGGVPVQRH